LGATKLPNRQHRRTRTIALSKAQAGGERVARRKEQAYARLVAAAAEIIIAKGTHGLRVREITDRAHVGFGSFYSHFESKQDIIGAVVRDIVGSLAAPVAVDDAAEAAAISHRWFIRLAVTEPQRAQLLVNLERADVMLETSVHQGARELLTRGIETGRFRPMDIETTLTFVVGATIAVMRGVLEGKLDNTADIASAEAFLGVLGVDAKTAATLSRKELPELLPRTDMPAAASAARRTPPTPER
jgi:AcrR family transcriptional regulator